MGAVEYIENLYVNLGLTLQDSCCRAYISVGILVYRNCRIEDGISTIDSAAPKPRCVAHRRLLLRSLLKGPKIRTRFGVYDTGPRA